MEKEFWLDRWKNMNIGFHKDEYNPDLLAHFDRLEAKNGEKILVPLCGKTRDMVWLSHKDLYVHGVELSEDAVNQFFYENNFTTVEKQGPITFHQNITLEVGDFFNFEAGDFHFIYDRAAMVALPPEMRKRYAKVCTEKLVPNGKILLITYEYDQSKLSGPPFSVPETEVRDLYSKTFTVELLSEEDSENATPKMTQAGIERLNRKVYLLTKNK